MFYRRRVSVARDFLVVRVSVEGGDDLEIPDEWWTFSEMDRFSLDGARCFNVKPTLVDELVPIALIEPPKRAVGVEPLKKMRLVPILMAFVTKSEMPPIKAYRLTSSSKYRYKLYDGFHRFYASVAAKYPMVPVSVVGDCE